MVAVRTWPSRAPLVVLAFITCTLCTFPTPPFAVSLPATACLVIVLWRVRRGPDESDRTLILATGLSAAAVGLSFVLLGVGYGQRSWTAYSLGGVAVVTAAASVLRPRLFVAHVAASSAFLVHVVHVWAPSIDVGHFMRDSVAALLKGVNPYGLTSRLPYAPDVASRYYAPELIDGDRILIGFPYMPGALIGYVPGHLLGDVRLVSVAAVVGSMAVAWRMASEPVGRVLAAALPLMPGSLLVSANYWIEPLLALGAALTVMAWRMRSPVLGALGVFVLLSVKQYAVVWLPLEALVRRRLGWRAVVGASLATSLVVGAAFVSEPGGFVLSVVKAQFVQPYRPDSLSLAVDLVDAGVPIPSAVLSAGSLLAGLAVAILVRMVAPQTATWTALGLGLTLLATILLSKQAFMNYYFLVHACVVLAVAAWPCELANGQTRREDLDPVAQPHPDGSLPLREG